MIIRLTDSNLMLKEGCEPRCPGCPHRALGAQESQAQKEKWLAGKLAAWADRLAPLEAVSEEGRWHYRDKICLSTAWGDTGWRFGLTARAELIEIPRCPVHSQSAREAIGLLSRVLPPGPGFPMVFYVQSKRQLTLVLKTSLLPSLQWLAPAVQQSLAEIGIEGLWLHLNPSTGRRIFHKNGWHLLWGRPRSLDGNGLLYGPSAFQQLIPELYQGALDQAEVFLAPLPQDSVIDLYCGIGTSLLRWIGRGARAVGVELGGEAIDCAKRNAPEALLLRGRCADRIPQLNEWLGDTQADARRLLYVNPPRTGIEAEVLRWAADDFRPVRMAYLSCSAGTLARDLMVLERAAYRVERIIPYDFFPQTYHVETLVLLSR